MRHTHESKNGRIEDPGTRLANDFEALKSNFSDLKNDVSRMMGNIADAGKAGKQVAASQAHVAIDTAKEKVHDALDNVKDRANDAKEYGQDALDQLTKQIRANPGTATLIAFGVGFIASRLILSRRS